MSRPKTISKAYISMNKELHARPNGFGGGGHKHARAIVDLALKHECKTLLDYGAGQQTLSTAIAEKYPYFFREIQDYDPAVLKIAEPPRPADIVVCTDVLEHIEPQYLENVLKELYDLTGKVIYLYIATITTAKTLSDGRSAHLIVEKPWYWEKKITEAGFVNLKITENVVPEKDPPLRGVFVTAQKESGQGGEALGESDGIT